VEVEPVAHRRDERNHAVATRHRPRDAGNHAITPSCVKSTTSRVCKL
jgi:hypothetical protein